jgi:ABC-type sulfate transport system permease component
MRYNKTTTRNSLRFSLQAIWFLSLISCALLITNKFMGIVSNFIPETGIFGLFVAYFVSYHKSRGWALSGLILCIVCMIPRLVHFLILSIFFLHNYVIGEALSQFNTLLFLLVLLSSDLLLFFYYSKILNILRTSKVQTS